MRFVLETGVFGPDAPLAQAARAAGHRVAVWDDGWWEAGLPSFAGEAVFFHGSLGNAARLATLGVWSPGSLCATERLRCSVCWPAAEPWLLSRGWLASTASALVSHPPAFDPMFVRPDSPLKPFSGRVLARSQLSMAALDFGFYYDDPDLPVIVAPVRPVSAEYRCVIADGCVVAGSAYEADGRRALSGDLPGEVVRFASEVASSLPPPERMYVLDVARSEGAMRLVELNPLGGADLYGCDPSAVVEAIAATYGP